MYMTLINKLKHPVIQIYWQFQELDVGAPWENFYLEREQWIKSAWESLGYGIRETNSNIYFKK